MNFIRRLNRVNFYFSNWSFKNLWIIGGMNVIGKYKTSAQYSLKLCLLGQKNTGIRIANATIGVDRMLRAINCQQCPHPTRNTARCGWPFKSTLNIP